MKIMDGAQNYGYCYKVWKNICWSWFEIILIGFFVDFQLSFMNTLLWNDTRNNNLKIK